MKDILSGFLFGVGLIGGLAYVLFRHTPMESSALGVGAVVALFVSGWLLWSQRSES
jgi:hypothetical protein